MTIFSSNIIGNLWQDLWRKTSEKHQIWGESYKKVNIRRIWPDPLAGGFHRDMGLGFILLWRICSVYHGRTHRSAPTMISRRSVSTDIRRCRRILTIFTKFLAFIWQNVLNNFCPFLSSSVGADLCVRPAKTSHGFRPFSANSQCPFPHMTNGHTHKATIHQRRNVSSNQERCPGRGKMELDFFRICAILFSKHIRLNWSLDYAAKALREM